MALTPLTSANSAVLLNGDVVFFVGNQAIAANKVRIARLDGSGTDKLNPVPFTVGTQNILVTAIGTSHIVSGVAQAPQARTMALLAGSGVYAAYNSSTHVFGQNGATAGDIRLTYVPQLVAYINSVKANYTQVIALYEGMINGLEYFSLPNTAAEQAKADELIADMRAGANAVAATGAKVILLTSPPSHRSEQTVSIAQGAAVERVRQTVNNDMIANFALYGALGATASHRDDPQLYPYRAYETYPDYYADATHYTIAGQQLWGERHLLPEVMRVAKLPNPVVEPPVSDNPDDTPLSLEWLEADVATVGSNNTLTRMDGQDGFDVSGAFSKYAIGPSNDTNRGYVEFLYRNSLSGIVVGLCTERRAGHSILDIRYGFNLDGLLVKDYGTQRGEEQTLSDTFTTDTLLRIAIVGNNVVLSVGGTTLSTLPLADEDVSKALFVSAVLSKSTGTIKNPIIQGANVLPAFYYEPSGTIKRQEDSADVRLSPGDWTIEAAPSGNPAAFGGGDAYATNNGAWQESTVPAGCTQAVFEGFVSSGGGTYEVSVNGEVVATGSQYSSFNNRRPYFATIPNLLPGDVVRMTKTGGAVMFADQFKFLP
ncbi:SGNH/GDSL hydrolase family protein [Hymenobacter sediminicola]|uniref:SGNH/GDSL hydrolase family protein n=1 Tax=Hymenobacter sediminicola TaxID=2761579 RepID=A0A7G7W761_9BACT|nr:SGNH/GDSL hydrolase family protein [Hymenobacter sediminicola]QNH62204.1 SGNH/GDSL hydrolase family protein [Hymenobacter sediminicola]